MHIKIKLLTLYVILQNSAAFTLINTDQICERNAQINKAFEGTDYYDVSTDLLRSAKIAADLTTIPHEWGHFDCYSFQSPMTLNMDFFIIEELLSSCPEQLKDDLENLAYTRNNEISHNHYIYRNPINHILLTGPSSSGKTSLSLAIASKTGRDFIHLPAGSLSKEYTHSPLSILNNLFFTALLPEQPRIIIFDEIPALTDVTSSEYDPILVKHFCSYLDQCRLNPNLIIIVIAQNSKTVPDAIREQFSGASYCMPHLTTLRRQEILKHYLCENCKIDLKLLRDLVKETEGFNLRELSLLIKRILNINFSRALKNGAAKNGPPAKGDIMNCVSIFKNFKNIRTISEINKPWNLTSLAKPCIVPLLAFLAGFYIKMQC